MNEKMCVEFLMQIFWQAYESENFYRMAKKKGVNFQSWPDGSRFNDCKKFDLVASSKGHLNAMNEVYLTPPSNSFLNSIGEENIEILYSARLNFLRSVELGKKLLKNPEDGQMIIENHMKEKSTSAAGMSLAQAVHEFIDRNEKDLITGNQKIIIKGFENLSNIIGGFNEGRVTLITAHTGFGKTNLAINLMRSCLNSNLKTIYINMEMEMYDLTRRFLQSEYSMKQYEFDQPKYATKVLTGERLWMKKGHEHFITDGSTLSVSDISGLVSEIKRDHKIDILFVDYDQKIADESKNSDDEWRFIQKVVERLEGLSKREKIHVVLFAQTDEEKAGAPRSSKRAVQPASACLYFHKHSDGSTVLKFVKNRFGPTDKIISIDYNAATSYIAEIGIKEETFQKAETPRGRFS